MSSNGHETKISGSSMQKRHQVHTQARSGGVGLFFADATLDLDEAHDIAETPEPPRRCLNVDPNNPAARTSLRLPTLDRVENNLSAASSSSSRQTNVRNAVGGSHSDSPSSPRAGSRPPQKEQQQQNRNALPESPSSSKSLSGPMNRITSDGGNLQHPALPEGVVATTNRQRARSRPRWPRDLAWAVAFCAVVPLGLAWPTLLWHRQNIFGSLDYERTPLAQPALRHATFWSIILAYICTLLLAQGLYRTPGGGEGDDLRYKASQFLLACVPVSVAINAILVLAFYFLLPRALYFALIPLWYLVRDVYLFRRWKLQGNGVVVAFESPTPAGVHSSQPNSARHAFFQALSCMALDILSRSLRRRSFHRCIVTLLTLQGIVMMVWRWAVMGALHTGNPVTALLALVAGKWATGTVARLLSLIASGGVASWFAENAAMIEEQELQERALSQRGGNKPTHDNDQGGYDTSGIPEEYRAVDASIYQSVLDFDDDGLDEDGQDDFQYGFPTGNSLREDEAYNRRGGRFNPRPGQNDNSQRATVKAFFLSGIGVSFGSVAQCGLLGGPAQFVWCQLRKVDATRTAIVYRLQQQPRDFQPNRAVAIVMGVTGVSSSGGFRGMRIGQDDGTSLLNKLLNRVNVSARAFVRSHSDLAMSHVAAYYKGYKRAALDVSSLVEQAGMEPIIHDDITTHITSCVGGSITGAILIFTGYTLVRKLENDADTDVLDSSVAKTMILSFFLCYTLIFTVLEPLRASIKACYVCFAERPESLRQAFPLIFHRLSRMAETNLSIQ